MQWFMILDLDECDHKWPPKVEKHARLEIQNAPSLRSLSLPENYRLSPVFPLSDDSWKEKHPLTGADFYYIDPVNRKSQ